MSGAGAGSSSASTDEGSLADDATISAQYTGGSGIGGITPLVYNPESDGPPVFHSGVWTGDDGRVQFVQTADTGNQGTGEGGASQIDGKSRARSWWGIRGWFLGDGPIDDGGAQVVQTADTGTDGKTTSKSGGSLIATMGDLADDAGSYVGRSSKSLILGDWTDEKPTELSIGAGIGLGVLGVDLPLDIRDLSHTLTHREWSYKWGKTLAYNTIGLIPLIGVIKNLKNAKKLKYLDDAGELAKRSDDAADAAGDAGRRASSPPNAPADLPSTPPSKAPSDLPSDPPTKAPADPPSDTPAPINSWGPLFGQKRVSPTFGTEGRPPYLAGRSISDVAADLRAGRLTPDQLPIEAFRLPDGRLVSSNTRSLAALSEAGLSPTNVTIIPPTQELLRRLQETPLIPNAPLPGPRVPVTPSQSDPTIRRIIELP